MHLASRHFGDLDIEDDKIIHFPKGMIGFPEARRFCLLSQDDIRPYQWLHAVDQPDLAFVVVPQLVVKPEYRLELNDEDAARLRLTEGDVPVVLVVVTVPERAHDATVNLLAPIVINEPERLGAQVINDRDGYRTKHPLQDEGGRQAKEGDDHAGAHTEKETVPDAGR